MELDDLLEFDSSPDHSISSEPEAAKKKVSSYGLKSHFLIDFLAEHSASVDDRTKKGLNFYSETVNAAVKSCRIDPSRIKCQKWTSSFDENIDNLPDDLKPEVFMKCQISSNVAKEEFKCSGTDTKLKENKIKTCKFFEPSRDYINLHSKLIKKENDQKEFINKNNENNAIKITSLNSFNKNTTSLNSFNKNMTSLNGFNKNTSLDNSNKNNFNENTKNGTKRVINEDDFKMDIDINTSNESPTNKPSSTNDNFDFNPNLKLPFEEKKSHFQNGFSNNKISKYFSREDRADSFLTRDININRGEMNGNFTPKDINRGDSFITKDINRGEMNGNFIPKNTYRGESFIPKDTNRGNSFLPRDINKSEINGNFTSKDTNRGDSFLPRDTNRGETNGSDSKDEFNPFSFNNYYNKRLKMSTNDNIKQNGNDKGSTAEDEDISTQNKKPFGNFKTARTELKIQTMKNNNKNNSNNGSGANGSWLTNTIKKTLGTTKPRPVNSKYIAPFRKDESDEEEQQCNKNKEGIKRKDNKKIVEEIDEDGDEKYMDERYKGIEKVMIERIENEIMDKGKTIEWNDIAGLHFAKNTIQEIIVWPLLRPDIFTGLRRPPKGILLFGPPGTGKTLIGKCIASQSKSTFFCISASTLTSKWYGEGEKMVRALFAVASVHQPSVIFIDEIDSLLCQRSDQENETSRRLKTEFLVQLDGAATLEDDLVLVIGATNRPQELDEAARRRLVKRLYIPLPDAKARSEIIIKLLSKTSHCLNESEVDEIAELTETYSGADMANLCKDASMGPVRAIDLSRIDAAEVRPINAADFHAALRNVRPSVCQADLKTYDEWNKTFGCGSL